MAYANTIGILIAANDEASPVIKAAAANTVAATSSLKASGEALDTIGKSMTSVGSSMTKAFTLPMLAVGAASAKMAVDFQSKMELLHSSAGIAQGAIAGLSNQVLAMSGEVGRAPTELADGLYHIASAGNGIWNTSQMMDILKVASEGANLGMADLGDTTYSLSSAMASGIKGAKDASDMMAILTATVGAGDMKMNDLNGALSTGILSTAATFGVSVQSVGAALATLTDNGEHADEAATRLRMTMALMTSPSGAAAKQLQALGLTAEDAKNATAGMNSVFVKSGLTTTKLADDLRQPNGITVAMEDLKTHLEKAGLSASETDAILSKAFGGGRTDAALLTMLQNTGRMNDKFNAINASAGQFQQKLVDLNNTPQQRLKDAWSSIQASMVTLGEDILPTVASALTTVSQDVSNLVDWWRKLDPAVKSVLEPMAVSLAVGGPVLLGLGKLASMVGSAVGGFVKLGSAAKVLQGAFGLGSTAAEAGELTTALVGGSGLLAALGPIALGVAAVGVAGVGTYLALKSMSDSADKAQAELDTKLSPAAQRYKDLASDLGVKLKSAGSSATMLAVAQNAVANDTTLVAAATKKSNDLHQAAVTVQKSLGDAAKTVSDAQAAQNKALDQYGKNSPQYSAATDTLRSAQELYNQKLNDGINNTLNLDINTGHLHDAEKTLKQDTSDLTSLQKFLNDQLAGGVGVVAQFGPTALAQVPGIATLQTTIGNVVASWNGAVQSIKLQATVAGNVIQGIGADISHVQVQSDVLNSHLSAATGSANILQGTMGNLQGGSVPHHALGTNFAPGGLSLVGENGPELVNLPTGSKVATNKETQKMLHGGGDTNITITGNIQISSPEAATAFWDRIDKTQRLSRVGMAA